MRDPYEVLQIPKNSSNADIKKAYYKLAKEYHPDKNKDPDAIEKFKEINDAYKSVTSSNDEQIKNDFPDLFQKFNNIIDGLFTINNLISQFNNITNDNNIYLLKSFFNHDIIETPLALTLEQLNNGGKFNVEYVYKVFSNNFIKKTRIININNTQITQEYNEPVIEHKSGIYTLNIPNDYIIESGPIIIKNIAQNQDLHIKIIELKHPIFTKINSDLHITLDISLKESLLGFTRNILLLDNTDLQINCMSIVNPYESKIIANKGFKNGPLIIKFHILFPINYSDSVKNKLQHLL